MYLFFIYLQNKYRTLFAGVGNGTNSEGVPDTPDE